MCALSEPVPRSSQRPAAEVARRLDHVADKVDDAFDVHASPDDTGLVADSRMVRWAAPLFLVCTLGLVPWIVLLGVTLPQRQLSSNYGAAWTGYDVLELVGLGASACLAIRRSTRLPIAAAATGALLLADAWFDVLTTNGGGLVQALLTAVVFELPLAVLCFWLALHAQEIVESRIVVLRRRQRRTASAP